MPTDDKKKSIAPDPDLKNPVEGKDYYINEQGLLVFTEAYHLKRGHCCKCGCKHCPYDYVRKGSAD